VDRCRSRHARRDADKLLLCCFRINMDSGPGWKAWEAFVVLQDNLPTSDLCCTPRLPQPMHRTTGSDRLSEPRRGYDDESLESLAIQTDACRCFKAGCSKRKGLACRAAILRQKEARLLLRISVQTFLAFFIRVPFFLSLPFLIARVWLFARS